MSEHCADYKLLHGQKISIVDSQQKVREMFEIDKFVSHGTFGVIHSAVHLEKKIRIIIKFEKSDHFSPQLKQERNIYIRMEKSGMMNELCGFPRFYRFAHDTPLKYKNKDSHKIHESKFNLLAIEHLGKDLNDIFHDLKNSGHKQLTPSSVLNLGLQMFAIIQKLHENHIIHRDIKLGNFIMGTDYGLAKIFYNEKEGHIKNEVKMHVIGTTKYLSKNVLDLNTPSRRDDLISICYLLFELTTGKLPWSTRIMTEKYHKEFRGKTGQALKNAQKQKARELRECYTGSRIKDIKVNKLAELGDILDYCLKLEFDATPDYSLVNSIISKMIEKHADKSPFMFDVERLDMDSQSELF